MNDFLSKLKNFRHKLLIQGFSLVEIMAATSILGVVIMATISQLNLSSKGALESASDAEINSVTNKIISAIGTPAICTENFYDQSQNKTNYTRITSNGEVLIEKNTTTGTSNKEIVVSAIETRRVNDNEMILTISFSKKKWKVAEYMTGGPKREIPINTSLKTANGVINYCFANYDLVIKTAIQQACKGDSSHYNPDINPPYGGCEHDYAQNPALNPAPTAPSSIKCNVPGEFLKEVKGANGKIEFKCGKIMTDCPTGQAVSGFDADGKVKCEYVFESCPADGSVIVKTSAGRHVCTQIDCRGIHPLSAFNGFNPDGSIRCTAVSQTHNCGGTNWATSVAADGKITCGNAYMAGGDCAPGKYIQGVNPAGEPICVPIVNFPQTCDTGYAIKGIKANGDIDCQLIQRRLGCGIGHTYSQCAAQSGTLINAGQSNSHCKFTGGNCPNGWNPCPTFLTQTSATCTDSSNTFYCDSNVQTRVVSASPSYVNAPRAQVTCYTWTGASNNNKACAQVSKPVVQSIVSEIGCY